MIMKDIKGKIIEILIILEIYIKKERKKTAIISIMITIEKMKMNKIYLNFQEKIIISNLDRAIHIEVNKIWMIKIMEIEKNTIEITMIIIDI
jgi:hypothetical protein